jgi:hypothetical protein
VPIGVRPLPCLSLLAMILRFVPYIGAILAASLPIALAAAVGSDWSMSLWTIALFAVMEPLTGQVVEPLVCGRSAGLLYPSAIRAHVGASLTARLAGEPRLDIGYPEGADQGKKFGRPSALDAGQKRKIADRYAAGETMAELAREYEVGEATIFRALRLEPIAEGEIEGPAHEAVLSIQVMTFVTGACAMRSESRRSAVKVIPLTID